ncbi:CapA family protein [Tenacibaculum sp. SSH1-16]|uniref:CapA family protein n=1 Tax=Tenacibaculum sp. SSH1-16 TaxID=3136667 RepID=UPI0032C3FA55|nr:hypothetical protein BACT7_15600 [Tenacibaculum mesophilum]
MKIAFLGDVALFGRFDIVNNPEVFEYFSELKNTLNNVDYIVANLEAPFLNDGKKMGSKSAYLAAKKSNIEILKFLGINAVSLANNHVFDYGLEGCQSTIELLEENNIEWFGCAGKDLLIDNNEKLVFHGYCSYDTNLLGARKDNLPQGVNILDVDDVKNKMKEYQEKGYFNFISVHSGIEHVNIPSLESIQFAHALSELMPYVYYGHHPHVMQGVENINDSVIAYSLGNFCFDDVIDDRTGQKLVELNEDNKSSLILTVELHEGKLVNSEKIGLYQGEDRYEVHSIKSEQLLENYSDYLKLTNDELLKKRHEQISELYAKRNAVRNFKWLLSRLNFETIQRRYELVRNARLNKKHFLNKL